MGPGLNLNLLGSFAEHVASELGWEPNTKGPVTGYPID
jgi:hypothetical protein